MSHSMKGCECCQCKRRRQNARNYAARHKEKLKAKDHARYWGNLEAERRRSRENMRRRREDRPDEVRAYKRSRRDKEREHLREYQRQWRAKNKGKVAKSQRAYYERNVERYAARARARWIRNAMGELETVLNNNPRLLEKGLKKMEELYGD